MDEYAHGVYAVCRRFPRDEVFGITSQLRRSSLSVVLNYIEGYARHGDKTLRHFLNISYGSLQELKYLIEFTLKEGYISAEDFKSLHVLGNEIGAMLWGILRNMSSEDS